MIFFKVWNNIRQSVKKNCKFLNNGDYIIICYAQIIQCRKEGIYEFT